MDIYDAIAGYYASNILATFEIKGILQQVDGGMQPAAIAKYHGYDVHAFLALLEFLAQRTNVIERLAGQRYKLSKRYRRFYDLGFHLHKFITAYGAITTNVDSALQLPDLGRSLVDRNAEAEAYRRVGSPPNAVAVALIRERRIKRILDIGCGPGTLLTTLATTDPTFRGWGLDADAAMCAVARARVAESGVDSQIQILQGDARDIAHLELAESVNAIEMIHCKGLLDELFRGGDSQAVAFLSALRSRFPGRLLLVVDYYGKLTRLESIGRRYTHTLIHDVLQVLTAQGVPPSDVVTWFHLYEAAACNLEHAYEGRTNGIEWFVHVVAL